MVILLDKSPKKPSYGSLRLIEWKQSLASALVSPKPKFPKGRAKEVFEATMACQLFPKRYLGHTRMLDMPMQAREIGANDSRFSAKDFRELDRFMKAAGVFGSILARCHLLGSPSGVGPRAIPKLVAASEDRYVNGLLAFAAAYASQVGADFEELTARREEVHQAWVK